MKKLNSDLLIVGAGLSGLLTAYALSKLNKNIIILDKGDLFNKDSALFVPSGTMANLISVLAHCDRGDEVILGNKSHIFV